MTDDRDQKRWLIRSIALPVQECTSMPWPEFMRLLHGCWRQSTDLANWASQTCARNDVTRTPGMTQLPKYNALDLYALAFGREREKRGRTPDKVLPVVAPQYDGGEFWTGAKITAASLLRRVQAKYIRERGKIIWRRERRTPEFLFPYPFPVHQQAWAPMLLDKGRPVVAVGLPGGRISLRLRNGPEFASQMAVFRKLVDGDVGQQELVLTRQRSFRAGHTRQDSQRLPGGGHGNSYRVMVRIAYRIESYAADPAAKHASLRTGGDPFLTLLVPGEERQWLLHAPWVQNWIVEHTRFLQDFSDDLKYEKRWPTTKRRGLNRYRERRCEKHSRRMKSFLQETASQVVGHAKRRGCGRIVYDDSDRSFAESFPWHLFATGLQHKCDSEGLVLETAASGVAVEETNGEYEAATSAQ